VQEAHLREVPRARGDHAAGPDDPPHLGETCDRVLEEVEDELRQRRIEARIGPGQVLGRSLPHVCLGNPSGSRLDKR